MFTTLISDLGAVITYPQDEYWVQHMIHLLHIPVDIPAFIREYTFCRRDYDAGLITASTYWQNVANALHCTVTPGQIATLIDYDIRSWFNINPEMLEFIKSLKPLFKRCVLLSNINYECVAHLEKTYAWLELFDLKVYSCCEKVMKPDKAIFNLTLTRAAARAEDCIFIDDNSENIKSSRELGMHAVLFKNVQDLKAQFKRFFV
jgi:putative hydrolase of the HAD superfamily